MTAITVEKLIELYGLESHPEGGFFVETYRAKGQIAKDALPQTYKGDRDYSTAIYYLLPEGTRSKLHRLPETSDEIFHFYLGDPMTVVQIMPDGKIVEAVLGHDVAAGQKVQHVIPGGCWFGAYPNPGSRFCLVGCTVAPGFDFADFEMGDRADLLKQYPDAKEIIERLTD